MTAARVSPDGRYLAYALSEAGSDWRTIRVREVATGDDLPDVLPWTKWIDPTWLPDESGFLYWRYRQPAGGEFTAAMGAGELMLHRLGDDPAADALVWSRPDAQEWMADPWVAADGGWLVLTSSPGTDSRSAVHARRLVRGRRRAGSRSTTSRSWWSPSWRTPTTSSRSDGDTLYLRTERDAPRGRLVAVDLATRSHRGRRSSASTRRRAGRRAAGRRVVRAALVVRRGAPDRDRRPGRRASRLAGAARADLGHRVELPGSSSRDLRRRHLFHQSGPVVPAGPRGRRLRCVAALAAARAEIALPDSDFRARRGQIGGRDGDPDDGVAAIRPAAGSAGHPAVRLRRLRHPGAARLFGDVRQPGSPPAGCWPWRTCGAAGSSAREWHRAGMLHHKQNVFDDLYRLRATS